MRLRACVQCCAATPAPLPDVAAVFKAAPRAPTASDSSDDPSPLRAADAPADASATAGAVPVSTALLAAALTFTAASNSSSRPSLARARVGSASSLTGASVDRTELHGARGAVPLSARLGDDSAVPSSTLAASAAGDGGAALVSPPLLRAEPAPQSTASPVRPPPLRIPRLEHDDEWAVGGNAARVSKATLAPQGTASQSRPLLFTPPASITAGTLNSGSATPPLRATAPVQTDAAVAGLSPVVRDADPSHAPSGRWVVPAHVALRRAAEERPPTSPRGAALLAGKSRSSSGAARSLRTNSGHMSSHTSFHEVDIAASFGSSNAPGLSWRSSANAGLPAAGQRRYDSLNHAGFGSVGGGSGGGGGGGGSATIYRGDSLTGFGSGIVFGSQLAPPRFASTPTSYGSRSNTSSPRAAPLVWEGSDVGSGARRDVETGLPLWGPAEAAAVSAASADDSAAPTTPIFSSTRYCRNCSQPFNEIARAKEIVALEGRAWDALSMESHTCSRDCFSTLRAEGGYF